MAVIDLQYAARQKRKTRVQNGKLGDITNLSGQKASTIALIQVCLHCGREFTYNPRRKLCPACASILRTKTTVLKAS